MISCYIKNTFIGNKKRHDDVRGNYANFMEINNLWMQKIAYEWFSYFL